MIPVVAFRWDGEAMRPLSPRLADKEYVVGQVYRLEHREERSSASHAHYFACINEAWQSLPEWLARRFPTPEHLRKYALIRAGYRDERSIVCSSKAEAQRLASFIRPMDDFAAVSTNGPVVVVWTAKSQSTKAMGRKEFQASKDAVLGVLAEMIGTTADSLKRAAASSGESLNGTVSDRA